MSQILRRNKKLDIGLLFTIEKKLSIRQHRKVNPNKAGLFEGSFSWGESKFDPPLHNSKRTYLISI